MLTFRVTKIEPSPSGADSTEIAGLDTLDRLVNFTLTPAQHRQFVRIGAKVGSWVSYDKRGDGFSIATKQE